MDVQNHLGEFENVSARLLGTLSNLRYGKDMYPDAMRSFENYIGDIFPEVTHE